MNGTRFEVDIRYGWGMPVAFVRAPDGEIGPSYAVAIVREFLRSEFKARLSDSMISFTCMGPSPMWNDCFVKWGSTDQEPILETRTESPPGYQQIDFNVRPSTQGRTLVDAYELIKNETQDELSFYYELVSRSNLFDLRKDFVEGELAEIVLRHQSGGLGAWVWRRFVGGRRLSGLLLEIHATESEHRRWTSYARSEWGRIQASGTIHPFDSALNREFDDGLSDQIEAANSVASLLNDRQAIETQLVTLVVSSLLGGLAGASITALMQIG